MWSVGCIFAELLTCEPLFPGKGEVNQLSLCVAMVMCYGRASHIFESSPIRSSFLSSHSLFDMLGTPNDDIWDGFSELPHAKTVGESHIARSLVGLTHERCLTYIFPLRPSPSSSTLLSGRRAVCGASLAKFSPRRATTCSRACFATTRPRSEGGRWWKRSLTLTHLGRSPHSAYATPSP